MNYREAAIRYLGTGAKSVKQVEDYLIKREATEEDVLEVVSFLKDLGYLDDVKFARGVFEREYEKGRGKTRTLQYLKSKGVSSEALEEGYERFLEEYEGEYDERSLALKEGIKALSGGQLDEKTKAKIARRLATKGFSPKDIYYTLDKLKNGNIR